MKTTNPTSMTHVKIGMLSLGCPKTLVDSEVILGKLPASRYEIVDSVTDCDIALLNTCAFIQEAQQESVDRILELIELKKQKQIRAVIVMGCLVQRFPRELQKDLKEVDAFVGSGEYQKIAEIVDEVAAGKKVFEIGRPGYLTTSGENRIALTPAHYRYLKISEGCDHTCAFCVIPSFRGKHRSRTIEDVVLEAQGLARSGAKELVLTGQDTSYFGRDHGGEYLLPRLLHELNGISELEWIRVLYAYPSCLNKDLMIAMRDLDRVCKYLDMPLQHASDRMLTAMNRGITKRRTVDLLRQFRETVPNLAIRTTFIVGYPGETEEDFEELMAFMAEMKFERLGIFTYSQEEGSAAAKLGDQINEDVKQDRLDRAMRLQQSVSLENNERMVGKTLKVLVEERDEKDSQQWIGRSEMDAPEVDGNVIVRSPKQELRIGEFYPVRITGCREYDLLGER
ncbi:MAG: 30S ribosomal protein S12 methylthiotransferase RimO [Candidatus Omnitrophota bacterium]|nr:30S ribosomal protein S12 methylthiotransferase RimO [Candidatus Omnitrophota bacterium]